MKSAISNWISSMNTCFVLANLCAVRPSQCSVSALIKYTRMVNDSPRHGSAPPPPLHALHGCLLAANSNSFIHRCHSSGADKKASKRVDRPYMYAHVQVIGRHHLQQCKVVVRASPSDYRAHHALGVRKSSTSASPLTKKTKPVFDHD